MWRLRQSLALNAARSTELSLASLTLTIPEERYDGRVTSLSRACFEVVEPEPAYKRRGAKQVYRRGVRAIRGTEPARPRIGPEGICRALSSDQDKSFSHAGGP